MAKKKQQLSKKEIEKAIKDDAKNFLQFSLQFCQLLENEGKEWWFEAGFQCAMSFFGENLGLDLTDITEDERARIDSIFADL